MEKVIPIANQKGGVGKTTTAINISASLAAAEYNILLIDLDPQSNSTSGSGSILKDYSNNLYNAIIGDISFSESLVETELSYLKLVPSSIDLAGAEIELLNLNDREFVLANLINEVKDDFDYIFIDSPPSMSLLTLNGLVAADSVLIPIQCEYYAMEGLSLMLQTISMVKDSLNKDLFVEGILLTMFDKRNNLNKQVKSEIETHYNEVVYDTIIKRNVRLGESPSFGKPIILYDTSSSGCMNYLALANEFLEKNKEVSL